MIDYHLILSRKFHQKDWSINGETYEGLNWFNKTEPKPTKEELDALWPEVQAEIAQEAIEQEQQKNDTIAKLEALGISVDDLKGLLR